MRGEAYYREMAAGARRVAARVHQPDLIEALSRFAQDCEEMADDLRDGAVNVRHPELMNHPERR
jgi:hypothetical protein